MHNVSDDEAKYQTMKSQRQGMFRILLINHTNIPEFSHLFIKTKLRYTTTEWNVMYVDCHWQYTNINMRRQYEISRDILTWH